jgi:hypothetical protein
VAARRTVSKGRGRRVGYDTHRPRSTGEHDLPGGYVLPRATSVGTGCPPAAARVPSPENRDVERKAPHRASLTDRSGREHAMPPGSARRLVCQGRDPSCRPGARRTCVAGRPVASSARLRAPARGQRDPSDPGDNGGSSNAGSILARLGVRR